MGHAPFESRSRGAAHPDATGIPYQVRELGRLPCLDEADKARLVELLLQGPESLGYETPLWTCERVAHLIEKNFEVDYHPGHVWCILRQLNWSVHQPVGRALERNEALIDDWKRRRWPEIKKSSAGRPHDRLYRRKWSESTDAPTANLGTPGADAGSAVSLQLEDRFGHRRCYPWNCYFEIFGQTIKSEQIIEFLKHLLRYIDGNILLIWDRLPAHRSRVTQKFIHDKKGRLEMEYLPPYAPELNPVEC